jgi:hypothetical protein
MAGLTVVTGVCVGFATGLTGLACDVMTLWILWIPVGDIHSAVCTRTFS